MTRISYSWKLVGFGKYEEVKTEIMDPREPGFYWVKYQGQWMIAEWIESLQSKKWFFLGDIGGMKDEHFDKIHEEKIESPWY